MSAIENARAALEAAKPWPESGIGADPNVNGLRGALHDLIAEHERVLAEVEWDYAVDDDADGTVHGQVRRYVGPWERVPVHTDGDHGA